MQRNNGVELVAFDQGHYIILLAPLRANSSCVTRPAVPPLIFPHAHAHTHRHKLPFRKQRANIWTRLAFVHFSANQN